ncbi:hypothetical protein [Pontibacter cellulosilyticus]|uniref:Uncharacterized protein n=1 Tax=Pontibacter cellulosilyticus TaxID=1720253 RepID=A0A923N5P7_9BACT|nr:hypothetical protein [Pontibacter cellulosilyticus]MBC5991951.1 hypothetical protein [Pontibacter cellulosilyticus]
MKKLIFIPLCFSLFFTSCNDEDTEEVIPAVSTIDAEMRGDWTNTDIKRVYYSDRDTVMYEDSVKRQAYFNFNGQKMTVTLPGSSDQDVWNYSFPDKNDSTYIELKQNNVTTKYKVTTLSGDQMVWVEERPWAGFPEEVPDNQKTTSKVGVYTWKFVRGKK